MNSLWYFRNMTLTFLSFVVFFIVFIILQQRKKKKVKGNITVKWLSIFNWQVMFSTIWLFFALYYLYFFVKNYYLEAYSFFIPKYLDRWYELFNYRKIVGIENLLLLDNNNINDLCMVYSYETGFNSLCFGLCYLIIAALSLYIGLQNIQITNNGVLHKKDLYLWKDINEYKWNKPSKSIIQVGVRDYYKLELFIAADNNKRGFNLKPDKVTLNVKLEDKEIVDKLIFENNVEQKR